MKTRLAPKPYKDWEPHGYQARAVGHLVSRGGAALFMPPGLGKTSTTLAAVSLLKAKGMLRRVLIVAPRRVCHMVWRQEGSKWTQFRHLKFRLLHGNRKAEELREGLADDTDIFLVNPEGLAWLDKALHGSWPFDTLVIDELTKFKNARAQRSRILRARTAHFARRWGLTGTPTPNGLLDLFGQMLVIDGGQALGKYITQYRERYFMKGYDGYKWTPREDAFGQITERLRPFVLQMEEGELPELVDVVRRIDLPAKTRAKVRDLQQKAITEIAGTEITAANAAVLWGRLKQIANGAIYREDDAGKRSALHIHDAKLDDLVELIDEMQGAPLLIAYEFNHDLERILDRIGKDTPYLGKGVSDKKADEYVALWNEGKVPVLLAHPASAGHGLNLQSGGCSDVCWFSVFVDFELYDQFVRRVRRQGTTASSVRNHILVADGTADDAALALLRGKDSSQKQFMHCLAEFAGLKPEEKDMSVRRLEADNGPVKGWDAFEAPAPDNSVNREELRAAVQGQPEPDDELAELKHKLGQLRAEADTGAAEPPEPPEEKANSVAQARRPARPRAASEEPEVVEVLPPSVGPDECGEAQTATIRVEAQGTADAIRLALRELLGFS